MIQFSFPFKPEPNEKESEPIKIVKPAVERHFCSDVKNAITNKSKVTAAVEMREKAMLLINLMVENEGNGMEH